MFIKSATDNNIRSVINDNKTVLLKVQASWCGPCKALTPTINKIAEERANTLPVYDLDIDDSPSAAQALRIQGVPTMILFHDGKEIARKSGNLPKATVDSWINSEFERSGI